METNIDQSFNNNIAELPKRSSFLSTLCILTWVCCGLMFISTLYGLFFKPSTEQQMEQIEQLRQFNPVAADKMEEALANQGSMNQIINQIISLIAMGLSAYGAFLMWQLNKKGFFVYIAGEILPYAAIVAGGKTAMSAMDAFGGMGTTIIAVIMILMIVTDIIFITMYALNLKHMEVKKID